MVDSVRKVDDVLTTLLQDGQSVGDITPQDVRESAISSTPPAFTGLGFYLDSQFTSGSPKALVGTVRTKVTNNAVIENQVTNMAGLGFSEGSGITLAFDPWNPSTNKFEADYANAFYTLQLAFKATTMNNNNFLTVEIDVGGGTGAFLAQTQLFAKGTGVETDFVFNWTVFAGSDFVLNGAELFVTANANADMFGIGITIARIGRPYI